MNIISKVWHALKMHFSARYRFVFEVQLILTAMKKHIELFLGLNGSESLDVRRMHLKSIERHLVEYLKICPHPSDGFWEQFVIKHKGIFTLMAIAVKYNLALVPRCLDEAMRLAEIQLKFSGHGDRAQNAGVCLAAARHFNNMLGQDVAIEKTIAEGFEKVSWAYVGPPIFQMP